MPKLKDVYDLIDGVCLISTETDNVAHWSNTPYLKEPPTEILEKEVKAIEPFYNRKELFKYGVIIILKD